MNISAMERLLRKTSKQENGCWIYKSSRNKAGYCMFHFEKKTIYAHRASWILCYGSIPEKLIVMHKCDTPSCINPEHLVLGTQKDNMQDALKKGRMKGLANGSKIIDGKRIILR